MSQSGMDRPKWKMGFSRWTLINDCYFSILKITRIHI